MQNNRRQDKLIQDQKSFGKARQYNTIELNPRPENTRFDMIMQDNTRQAQRKQDNTSQGKTIYLKLR